MKSFMKKILLRRHNAGKRNFLRNAASFKISEDIGRLAENIVFTELKRRNRNLSV
jgi:predicted AAA+ superfamily ATPase